MRLAALALIALGLCAFALQQISSPLRQEQIAQVRKHGLSALSGRLPQADLKTRLKEFRPIAQPRLKAKFKVAGVVYPPKEVVLVGLKEEKRLEVYARGKDSQGWVMVDDLPILAASGVAGPKLREGDRQVPEGIYRIEFLNPNSRFHLSLRVNYPNDFDRKMALRDKRTNLGGDIMIHGGALSVGCLAMGDTAVEDLFVLIADVGLRNASVILAPYDFRERPVIAPSGSPEWTEDLYEQVAKRLRELSPVQI